MSPETRKLIIEMIENGVASRVGAIEFEMAYQARIAMDRIRFAIKHTENFAPESDAMRQDLLQLLDALQRLETLDRRFQVRSQTSAQSVSAVSSAHIPANGQAEKVEGERSIDWLGNEK